MKTKTNIPAGIMDMDIEFFSMNGEVYFIQDGSTHDFKDLSIEAAHYLRIDLEEHPKALEAIEQLGITDPINQLKQYVMCRFGDFDNRADLTPEGVTIKEYVNCASRGSCKYEGILCQHIFPTDNGHLTPREIEVIKLIIQDLPDKIIADRLDISINTMAVHRRNIENKIGCHTKVGITAFAYENNLIG